MTKNQTLVVTETSGDSKAPTTRRCNCGCGQATSTSKTQYKPGHDARHASAIARTIVEKRLTGSAAEAELAKLGSEKLHHKAAAMVTRLVAKGEAQAVRQAAKANKPAKASKKDDQTEGSKRAEALIDGLQEAFTGALAETVAKEEAEYEAEAARRTEARQADEEDWAAQEAELAQVVPAEDVKVGRWTYPSRVVDGKQERNEKRDGSGNWIAL